MIELKNLTKVYETVNYNVIALSDINYKFDTGEVVVLLGRSGSGKSTLLNIIGGFDRDYAGKYSLGEENMKDKTEREIDTIRKRRIGFVFQQYVLLNNLTVLENVELALRVIGVINEGSRKRAALHALKLVGLRDHAEKFPYELSGGQKQRVAIARAFVKNPDIIIADEPTAALDSRTSKEILDLLRDLCRTKLLIIATHNKSIVRDYGTRIIELKSGYTIKNELITDRSLIQVDELDLIIDREITSDDDKIQKIIDIEKKVSEENQETVLKSLGVDLKNFRLNNEDKFDIDEEHKRRLIKERMHNTKLKTRIHRFLQTSDDFHGKRKYANKSFFRNIGLHLFSSLIFTMFLITIVFGLNFVTETFGGFNEKAMYSRTMKNENVIVFSSNDFVMEEYEQDFYNTLETSFVSDFPQTDITNARFLDELLKDPYFRYQYEQDKVKYIYSELEKAGFEDKISIYYNNSNIISKTRNTNLVFEELSYVYNNTVSSPIPYTWVDSFMNIELNENKIYQYDFVYSENNFEILSAHLLAGSRLPTTSSEVVIPVGYLFEFEIFTNADFKDSHGNVLEVIPSEMIVNKFNSLPDSEKTITISKSVITYTDGLNGVLESHSVDSSEFTITGLINFDGDINPYLEIREDILVANDSGRHFSLIFSNKATDLINFEVVNNTANNEFFRSIEYAEINLADYKEYSVGDIIQRFEEEYILEIKESIAADFSIWINTLNTASNTVSNYINDDLAGNNPSNGFMNDLVDNELFPGLIYQDLLDYYIAQHLLVINDRDEFVEICSTCTFGSREFYSILDSSVGAYNIIVNNAEYSDMLVNYGDSSRLTYQESTNRIIYEYYGHLLNNQFYASSNDEYYDFNIVSSFEQEKTGVLSLLNAVVPVQLAEFIPFFSNFQRSIANLEENPRFITFMENTNLDLLISSISTNAVRSVILVILYVLIYMVLLFSTIFLSIVLVNLYGNIYESATRKRIKELASLRVLGTSYDDIKDMITIENRRVAIFSYLSFILILQLLSKLSSFTSAPIKHYFMPLLGLFFDFNLYDVFVINYMVVGFVSIIFYFLVYRYIIRRVSTKKLLNIDTIQAIRDGDNL